MWPLPLSIRLSSKRLGTPQFHAERPCAPRAPFFAIVIAVVIAVGTAGAVAYAAPTPILDRGVVTEIVDGDTLILEGRATVRLVDIQAPKLPLDRPNFRAWPLADKAKAALSALSLGRTVRLVYGSRRIDRHWRLLAHLFDPAGTWIQGAMLMKGLARIYSFADNRTRIDEMLALESGARRADCACFGAKA